MHKILDIARYFVGQNLANISSAKDAAVFEKADVCCMCCQKFTEKDPKVQDYSHVTGRYRGAAHNPCNLNFRKSNFIPINMHYANYHLKLIIRQSNELNSCAFSIYCQTKLTKQKERLKKSLASLRAKKAASELRDPTNAKRRAVDK